MSWQLQEAKQRFSEVVRLTLEEGPQFVTRHGEEVVVVMSAKEYRKTQKDDEPGLVEFLLSGPSFDNLDLERSRQLPREIDFGD